MYTCIYVYITWIDHYLSASSHRCRGTEAAFPSHLRQRLAEMLTDAEAALCVLKPSDVYLYIHVCNTRIHKYTCMYRYIYIYTYTN